MAAIQPSGDPAPSKWATNYLYSNILTTSDTSDWTSGGIFVNTGQNAWQTVSSFSFTYSLEDFRKTAQTVREWAEEFSRESENFRGALHGLSGIVCRMIARELKLPDHIQKARFGYTKSHKHIFLAYEYQGSTYFLDPLPDLFGHHEKVLLIEESKVDPNVMPWLQADTWYQSESGLIARQRRDNWLEFQITLPAAKAKPRLQLEFSTKDATDLKKNLLRCEPFDAPAVKFLQASAAGTGLKTNLAKLLLDADPAISQAALTIAKALANR